MDFSQQMLEYTNMVNNALDQFLPEINAPYSVVRKAMRYSVQAGGKRIRPILALAVCDMLGGDQQIALAFGCAVECVHASSLIHDDLPCMDNDDLRRGKPSCHIQFGESTALLAGDSLILSAFEILSSAEQYGAAAWQCLQAVRSLAFYSGVDGMVGGQVIDLAYENRLIEPELLETMYRLKTGALLCAACEMGAIAAGAKEQEADKIRRYAHALGMAFQICDDILDVQGDEKLLGKPVGSDEQQHKANFVSLLGLQESKKRAAYYTRQALDMLKDFESNEFMVQLANELLTRKY